MNLPTIMVDFGLIQYFNCHDDKYFKNDKGEGINDIN